MTLKSVRAAREQRVYNLAHKHAQLMPGQYTTPLLRAGCELRQIKEWFSARWQETTAY
jgi:hypothetical protein